MGGITSSISASVITENTPLTSRQMLERLASDLTGEFFALSYSVWYQGLCTEYYSYSYSPSLHPGSTPHIPCKKPTYCYIVFQIFRREGIGERESKTLWLCEDHFHKFYSVQVLLSKVISRLVE